jgi:transcription elongation factor GreA
MAKEFKLSKERLQQLEEELNYLKTTREQEVAELLKVARSFGDLSENSEYDEAKNEQSKLYGRIAEVENILQHAVIIDESELDSDVVGLGSKVELEDMEFGDVDSYEIVGSQEANPALGRISDDSPIGRAIVGKTAGEVVSVDAPAGVLQFKIVSVAR